MDVDDGLAGTSVEGPLAAPSRSTVERPLLADSAGASALSEGSAVTGAAIANTFAVAVSGPVVTLGLPAAAEVGLLSSPCLAKLALLLTTVVSAPEFAAATVVVVKELMVVVA